jgi:hypothetical protein
LLDEEFNEFNGVGEDIDGMDDWFGLSVVFINPLFGRSPGGGEESLPVWPAPSFFRRCFL